MMKKEIPALTGYRIHEQQVRDVARNLRELYQTRRPRFVPPESGRTTCDRDNATVPEKPVPYLLKFVGETKHREGNLPEYPFLDPIVLHPRIIAVRCLRCGTAFPVADFFYTKKSGLCIDCWEREGC